MSGNKSDQWTPSAIEMMRASIEENRVGALCEDIGYGRVMQITSELWRRKDPLGALTVEPTFGEVSK